MDAFGISLAIFAAAVVAALVAVETDRKALLRVAKPLATLALFGVLAPEVEHRGDALFAAGLALSAAGDVALLFDAPAAFLAGLVLFLLAQLAYAAGFMSGGAIGAAWTPLAGLAAIGVPSGWLVRALLPNVAGGLRLPLVAYAAGISLMVGTALATLAGPWPADAALALSIGAVLFYVSDGVLAWNRFVRPTAHGQAVTLALYWAGQLALTLGARWAGE